MNSFKERSKRYLTDDKKFLGRLFDFDIIIKRKGDDDGIDIYEAVNVRYRVMKCNNEGCPRIKVFTNIKALEDHINIKHTLKKKKEEISHSSLILPKRLEKERRPRLKPITINLSSYTTTPTIGRFIGKQDVNVKRFEQQNQVKLQLVRSEKMFNRVQILMKPNVTATINVKSISQKLKSEWRCCVHEQQVHEQIQMERLKLKYASKRTNFFSFCTRFKMSSCRMIKTTRITKKKEMSSKEIINKS